MKSNSTNQKGQKVLLATFNSRRRRANSHKLVAYILLPGLLILAVHGCASRNGRDIGNAPRHVVSHKEILDLAVECAIKSGYLVTNYEAKIGYRKDENYYVSFVDVENPGIGKHFFVKVNIANHSAVLVQGL